MARFAVKTLEFDKVKALLASKNCHLAGEGAGFSDTHRK